MTVMIPALRIFRMVFLRGLTCVGFLSASHAGLLSRLFPGNELEAITVTEIEPSARLLRPATPDKPVYYAAVSGGFMNLGAPKAGEKPVDRPLVNQTMLKTLAKQGYLPSSPRHPAQLILVWTWGTFNAQRTPISPFGSVYNHRELLRFLGGEKLGLGSRNDAAFPELTLLPGLVYEGSDAARIVETAKDDLYFIVVTAYDTRSSNSKRPVLLWTTRISCSSRGFWLPEAMPALAAMGGPFIGRDTARPVWVRATDKFRPEVTLGDTQVVEYLERQTSNVVEVGASR